MTSARKGDLVLREFTRPEARIELVSKLLKIYRSATPFQIEALLSKPMPTVIIQGIHEARAAELIKVFQPHGIITEFTPDEESWQLIPIPVASAPPSIDTRKADPANPPPAPIPASPNNNPPVNASRAQSEVNSRKVKDISAKKRSKVRTVFKTVRITVLVFFLLIAVSMALQVRNKTMTPGHLFGVVQDKLHIWGILATTPAIKGGTESELLEVLCKPPPSIMAVKPEKLVSAYQALYAPRPDRRFLMAFDTLARRWAYISGEPANKFRARTADKNQGSITIELLKGRKAIHRVTLPLPTTFPDLMDALKQSIAALKAASADVQPAFHQGDVDKNGLLSGVRQLIDASDPRFTLMALDLLEEAYSGLGGRPEVYLEAARGYATLCFLLTPDMGTKTDELAAEALTFLALAQNQAPDLASAEVEAFLAGNLGYEKHAVRLLQQAEDLGKDRRSRILAAYMKEEVSTLDEILSEETNDTTHFLGSYLRTRLLREIGLNNEAEQAVMDLLSKWPSYPAVIEALYIGDLNLAKFLTIVYPLDILAFLESQASFQVYDDQSLEERFKALEGKSASDVASLKRFETLLEQWSVYTEGKARLFLDNERARHIFRIMYKDALYLRFNLLLNRWSKPQDAWNFTMAIGSDSEDDPLTNYMFGMVLREAGQVYRMRNHFGKILSNAESRGLLSYYAYWYTGGTEPHVLLPLVYSQLDGRPRDRLIMGEILFAKFYDVDGSAVIFRECLNRNPYFFETYRLLAHATGSDEPMLEAVKAYPDSIQMLQIAAGYFKKRENDALAQKRALSILDRAIELAPSKRSFAADKGNVLKNMGRYRESAEAYTRWIDNFGTGDLSEVMMKASRANAIRLMGNPQEALLSMEGAELSYQAGAMVQAARCYEDMGMKKQAAEWYKRTAERYPTTTWVGAANARFLWNQGDDIPAAKLLNRFRARTADNPAWYAKEFMEVFKTESVDRIKSAVGNLRRSGATDEEAMKLAGRMALSGRLDAAFEISSTIPVVDFMSGMEVLVYSHDFLERLKGKEEADRYFKNAIASQGGRMDLASMALYKHGEYKFILENIGDPDSYSRCPEYVWLMTAASWRALGGEPGDWKERLEKHFGKKSGMEPYFTIGRYLVGKSTREEVIKRINTPKRRAEVPYFLGLMARLEGDFVEADAWYQISVMTGLVNNMEYHAAYTELMNWTHLGSSHRNRKPGDDCKDVRLKLTTQQNSSFAQ